MSAGVDDRLGGERRIGEWWKAKVDLWRDDVLGFFVVLAHGAIDRWNALKS